MAIKDLYPSISPSLNLSFALTKALDPRITFARASTATYYDDNTVAKAEENLFLYSQEFDNAAWAQINVTVASNTADTNAPDGTATAEKLTITGGSGAHAAAQSLSMVVGTYTISVFAKKGTQFYFRFGRNTGAAIPAPGTWWWDVDAGTFNGTLGSGWANQSIVDAGNGWYRCTVSVTTTAAATDGFSIALTDGSGNNIFSADNNTFYIWQAQLEQRSSVTAPVLTTTQPITNYIPVLQTAAANVARFDHNPVTRESLGLLVEEQRTNLLTYSEQFNNASWIKFNSTVTANTIVAPDGTLTGYKLTLNDGVVTSGLVRQDVALADSTTHTISIYVKAGEFTNVQIQFFNKANTFHASKILSLSTGVLSGSDTLGTSSAISVGNGWYRFILAGVTSATGGTTPNVRIVCENTGNGFSGIYIWRAQLEQGAFATSSIKTEASQVTRSADAASITGSNFSSWFSNAEGTLYAEYRTPFGGYDRTVYELALTDFNNRIFAFQQTNNGMQTNVVANGTSQAQLFPATVNATTFNKVVQTYKANDFASVANGGNAQTDSSGIVPVVQSLWFGRAINGAGVLNGTIRKLAFYPVRCTNAQLQALTS